MWYIVLRDVAAGRCLGRAIVSKRLLWPRLDGSRGKGRLGGLLGMMLLRVGLLWVMLRRVSLLLLLLLEVRWLLCMMLLLGVLGVLRVLRVLLLLLRGWFVWW